MTITRITSNFVDRVGGDGFYDIKRAKTCHCKLIWIVIFVTAWSLVSFQVYQHISKYLTYPVDTLVTLKFDEAAMFPSISFCNLNPVKWIELVKPEANLPSSLMDILRPNPIANNSLDSLTKGQWDTEVTSQDYAYDNYEQWDLENHPEEVQVKHEFYNYYFKQPEAKKRTMGHQIEDMLTECLWQEKQCYPSNFTHYLHPEFGNCYAFNAGWVSETKLNKTILKAHLPGPSDGLSLTLFVESMEYIPLIADSTGVRVHVHSQDAPPHPEDTGFTVSAGFASALELKRVEMDRLALPYNSVDCKTWFDRYQEDIREFWPRANYSMMTCMKLCYQKHLLDDCECVHSTNYYLNTSKKNEGPCSISNHTQGLCMNNFIKRFRTGSAGKLCQAYCPQSCSEINYEVQYSSSTWPNEFYENIMLQTMNSRSSYLQEHNNMDPWSEGYNPDYVYDNLLKIDVYYQSLNYKQISEQPAYVLVDMLADLGGAVDLWVGMSVLAMVQCIEYLIEIFVCIFCKSRFTNSKEITPKASHNTINKGHESTTSTNMYNHTPQDFDYKPTLTNT